MTNLTSAAEAAREAARIGGKFGVQEHSAPEAALAVAPTADVVFERLSWVHSKDAFAADNRKTDLRVASFVADARTAAPAATRAQFRWEYDENGSRLVFSHYEDEAGEQVWPEEEDSYPDVTDFLFDDYKQAPAFGFAPAPDMDGMCLEFDDAVSPDIDQARAELAVGEKLEREADNLAIRYLLTRAMGDGLDPQKVEHLTDAQLADIRKVLGQATDTVRMAMEVPR